MFSGASPRDFLLATWEGGGSVPPMLTAARRLVERGHRVRVMSDACNRAESEATGAEFIPWRAAPSRPDKSAATDFLRDWETTSPEECFGRLRDVIMCGPAIAYARDTLAELDRRPADLVVSSELLFGVMAACESRGQRFAILTSNISFFPIAGLPPFGAGLLPATSDAERAQHAEIATASRAMFNRGVPALNTARRALGLHPIADLTEQTGVAARILLGTSQAFDFPVDRLPDGMRYVGPQLDDLGGTKPWVSPWPKYSPWPLVLVAFSTTFQNQADTIQRVIDAVAPLPARALVTLGQTLNPCDFRAPQNVVLRRTVSHNAVMREAAVVVTHAGHGTTLRALAHGRPLLCMPMGRDQYDNTVRVTARGAGIEVPHTAPTEEIRTALKRLLLDGAFSRAAQTLGDAIAAEASAPTLTQELEDAAGATRFPEHGEPIAA